MLFITLNDHIPNFFRLQPISSILHGFLYAIYYTHHHHSFPSFSASYMSYQNRQQEAFMLQNNYVQSTFFLRFIPRNDEILFFHTLSITSSYRQVVLFFFLKRNTGEKNRKSPGWFRQLTGKYDADDVLRYQFSDCPLPVT